MNLILAALAEAGCDVNDLSVDDISPLDHLHGRGLEATEELLVRLNFEPDHWVLDLDAWARGSAEWTHAAPMPVPRNQFACVTFDGKVFVAVADDEGRTADPSLFAIGRCTGRRGAAGQAQAAAAGQAAAR